MPALKKKKFSTTGIVIRCMTLVGFLAVGCVSFPSATADDDNVSPHHLRVVWQEDPAHEAIVSWTTGLPGDGHTVFIDTEPRHGKTDPYAERIESENITSGEYQFGGAFYHHASLTDLEPSTRYYFVVESNGHRTAERYFVTAPVDDRRFKLLYGGDSRSDAVSRRKVNDRIARTLERDPEILALVHGGDYIASGRSWVQWYSWLNDHELTTTRDGRVLPIVPARGNHESDGVLYNHVFGFPGGKDGDYWATRISNRLLLVTLDSNSSLAGRQRHWLEETLKTRDEYRWLVTSYHRPAYPAVKSPGSAKEHWVPLFEKYNVDLVCESDGHALKRTVPIRNDRHDPTGVVYVGEGGLGVGQRTPDRKRWYLQSPGMASAAHHFQVLEFTPERLTYRAILLDGKEADSYARAPRKTISQSPETVRR